MDRRTGLVDSVNSGYPRPSRFQTVEESMLFYDLDPSSKYWRKKYALSLESGDFGVPQELEGDAVSDNNQCEWDKKKAFINLYKHGVSFEDASLLFEETPPPGYEVVHDDPTDEGIGLESFWGIDVRDKMVARLGGKRYVIVKVDREHVDSGRVRLISVWKVPEKAVLKALKDHNLNSAVSVVLRVEASVLRRHVSASRNPEILAEVDRRIKAYENVRYLSSIM
jgi:uncharacterized DUF497 family protein